MSKLKCLLVVPPIKTKDPPYNIPLGAISLAAVIEKEGHDVAVFDNNAYRLSQEEVIGNINDESWDIIGMGSLVTTYVWQKRMFELLRKEFPETLLIAGGGLATSLKHDLMEWVPEIDIIVIGEGERTIVQILNNYKERKWEEVKGVYYRENGKIMKSPPQKLLTSEELSNLPFPKYDLLPLEEVYFKHSAIPLSPEAMKAQRRINIETSRGCPFTCTFCIDLPSGTPRNWTYSEAAHSKESKRIRVYDPKRTVELIKYLRLKYAVDFLVFTDEDFTATGKKHVYEFCDLMEKEGLTELDPPLHYGSTAHVNTIDLEMLKRLKEVGCSYLDLGVESMNADILSKEIKKGSTPERNEQGFNNCLEAGIYPITNFMIGFPGETLQSVYDTTKFLAENKIKAGPFFATPYPGTALFEKCKDKIMKEFGSLENFVIKCSEDVASDFVVNLTKYNDAELLGIQQMVINHDLEQIKKFAEEKREKIILD